MTAEALVSATGRYRDEQEGRRYVPLQCTFGGRLASVLLGSARDVTLLSTRWPTTSPQVI